MPFYSNGNAVQALALAEDKFVRSLRISDVSADGAVLAWSAADTLTLDPANANDEFAIGGTTAMDVRLNGATATRDVVFDSSANTLRVLDNAILSVGTGDDLSISHDATNTTLTSATGDLIIDNTLATGSTIVRLGTDTSATDFQVQNDTGTAILTVNGAGTTTFAAGDQVLHSTAFVPCIFNVARQVISDANTAISVATSGVDIDNSGGASTHTMADGTIDGQMMFITLDGEGGTNTATITLATAEAGGGGNNTITLTPAVANERCDVTLMWTGAAWRVIHMHQGALSAV